MVISNSAPTRLSAGACVTWLLTVSCGASTCPSVSRPPHGSKVP